MGYESFLSGLVTRGFLILAGLAGVAFICLALTRFVRSYIDRPSGMTWGAGPRPRTFFHVALGILIAALLCMCIGILGPRFREIDDVVIPGVLVTWGLIAIWAWIEKEFAWPGLLVSPEVRDVPGEFFVRREERRREREAQDGQSGRDTDGGASA